MAPTPSQRVLAKMVKELPAILTEPPEVDKPHRNLQVGDIVIVKDNSAPRNLWKLAHVDQTYLDDDGLVSKVHIAVADDSLDNERRRTRAVAFPERPIQKLILLPPTNSHKDRRIRMEEPYK